jgi:hypothetical protein
MSNRRPGIPQRSFSVTHTKIGSGSLKNGLTVASEGSIISHDRTGRKFLVVWQNVLNDGNIVAVGFLVDRAIERLIALG